MSGVQEGTFSGELVGRVAHWECSSLLKLAMWLSLLSGCQSLPAIRGQPPALDGPATEAPRRSRRIIDEPTPDEELISSELDAGLSPS